jgi:hypothetical protein
LKYLHFHLVLELFSFLNDCSSRHPNLCSELCVAVIRSGNIPESAILAESQVVREAIRIPGSGIRLVYHSSRAKGFYSTIQLQLTPATVPQSLLRVHLQITIEGTVLGLK